MEIISQRLSLPARDASIDTRPRIEVRPARREGALSFATISDLAGFEALEPEWRALFEASGQPQQVFQTFEWLAIWAPLYLDSRTRLSIVTGRIDGRLVLVWPLVVRRTCGLRILSGMGEPLSQYSDALIAQDVDDTGADAAFDHIMTLPVDVISLRRVRDDAIVYPLLRRRLGLAANRQASPLVYFADTPSVAAFEKRFSGKLRASRRRRRRRLDERGPVTFERHGPSAAAAALVVDALSFKRDWARQTGVLSPSLADPRFDRFFVAAALAGPCAPDLRVSALRCGDDILGIEMSVACKGHLFGHVLAPRPGYGALGLGGILAEMTIVNALEEGYASVDLLAPADSYKLEWTSDSIGVGDYFMSRSWLGHLYTRTWLRFGREATKTLVHRMQPALAALAHRLKTRSKAL